MEQKELKTKEQYVRRSRKWTAPFLVNVVLLISGIVMSLSGLIIQCHYHLLKKPGESVVLFLNCMEWNAVHVWISIFFMLVAIYHIWAHRKWYESVLKRKFFTNRRPTAILTVITTIVVITGLIPLCILYFGGNSNLRFSIIEIHDKVGILFFIAIFRHTIKRLKWYINYKRCKFQ